MAVRADFDSQEAFVRRMLFARRCRMERSSASKVRATIGVALALLKSGHLPTRTNASACSDVSRLDMWLLSMAWALAYVGARATYIMEERLLNREKSPDASWRRIADELEIPRADVQQIYMTAIPIFVTVLEKRELRENIDDIESYLEAVAAPYRCAAQEIGEPCAMPDEDTDTNSEAKSEAA